MLGNLDVFGLPGVKRYRFPLPVHDHVVREQAAELIRRVSGDARANQFLQYDYEVAVVNRRESAAEIARALMAAQQQPAGFDFETEGWSPEEYRPSLSSEQVYIRNYAPQQPDIELNPVCFQIFPHTGPVLFLNGTDLDLFMPWLQNLSALDGANLPFEQTVVWRNGGKLPRIHRDTIHMDYLLAETERQGMHGLKDCEAHYLGMSPREYKETVGKKTFREALQERPEDAVDYASFDAWGSSFLADVLQALLLEKTSRPGYSSLWEFYTRAERPYAQSVAHIDRAGIPVRGKAVEARYRDVCKEIERVTTEALVAVGRPINLSSNKELARLFYVERGYPVTTVTDGHTCLICDKSVNVRTNNKCKEHGEGALVNTPKVDEGALEALVKKKDNVAALIIERRGLEKKASSFVDPLYTRTSKVEPRYALRYPWAADALQTIGDRCPRVWHPALRASHVESGRLSAPLALTLPVEFKDLVGFETEAGWSMIDCDYSQLELRVIAELSRDPVLIEAFRQGRDMHSVTGMFIEGFLVFGERFLTDKVAQERLYNEIIVAKHAADAGEVTPRQKHLLKRRKQGKTMNFAKIYGAGDDKLAIEFGVPLAEAKKVSDAVMQSYAGMARFIEARVKELEADPVMVTLGGRNRTIKQILSQDARERAEGERLAINQSCQAGARDVIMGAMIQMDIDIEAGGGYGTHGRGSYGYWKDGAYVLEPERLPHLWERSLPQALASNLGALGRMGARVVNQIHDELLAIGPTPYRELIRDRMVALMEDPWGLDLKLTVPLKAEGTVGLTWAECKGGG